MAGEKENVCLEKIKIFLYRNQIEFYCEDEKTIKEIIKQAHPNLDPSKFPDFVFDNGFIEHFQVVGSKETVKKGAEHNISSEKFNRKATKESEKLLQDFVKNPPQNKMKMGIFTDIQKDYQYDNLQKSFKKNWDNHIDSLSKYVGKTEIGVFLVEYQGALIPKWSNGECIGFLKLNEDVGLLKYIAEYQDKIKYTIFFDWQNCQIIENKSINYLIENAPKNFEYGQGRLINKKISICSDRINPNKEIELERKFYE